MKQLVLVFLALLVTMVTAKSLHRNTNVFERALLSRLVSGRSADNYSDECELFLKLDEALSAYFNYNWNLTTEQWAAFMTLFPDYDDWWECYVSEPESEEGTPSEESDETSLAPNESGQESEEGSASGESAESSTSSPTPAETEATTSPQQSEVSRRLLLDKLLRDLQMNFKRREAFKHYNNKRRQ